MEPRLLLAINAELSLAGNAIITAADAGDFDDIVDVEIVGGDTLVVASPDGVRAGPGFNAIDANSASVPLSEIVGGEIRISTLDGDDLVVVQSSPVGISTIADTGSGSDEVRVGTPIAGIDDLLGILDLTGGDHDGGQTQLTIKDDSNALDTGDRLSVLDASAAVEHEYELSDQAFQRTTLGAGTAPVEFAGFETIDIVTTLGMSIMDITGTPDASRLQVTTHDADDQITMEDSGADSNVVITTAGGTDSVLIRDTGEDGGAGAAGLGSFVSIEAGDGGDLITLERNGDTSRVQLNGGASADQINVVSTAVDSVTLVQAGAGSDTVNVSSNAPASGHLDNIQGRLCIDGQNHDPGQVPLTIKGDDNLLDSGDVVNLSDALATADHVYSVTASTFRRSSLTEPTALVEYLAIETLNISTTEGAATVLVTGTAPSVNTNLTTQDAVDRLAIEDTGADSNVIIATGGGGDVVAISDTGEDGGAGAPGLGSFLDVNVGAGGDSFTLAGNGMASRLRLRGESGSDTVNVRVTAIDSVSLVETGSGSDTINVSSNAPASGDLNGIQGRLCIDGQDHDPGQVTLTIKGEDNSLDSGDILNISDATATNDHVYELSASTFRRTSFVEPTALVEYLAVETLNLNTTQGVATLLASNTADAANTNVTTQDSADLIAWDDTGADSNVVISTSAGQDTLVIRDTGEDGGSGTADLGSFVHVSGGDDGDEIFLERNGVGSRVRLDGQGGADNLNVQNTALDSVTLVQGGSGSDSIAVTSSAPVSGTLDGIQGRVCIEGQEHEADDLMTQTIKGDDNALEGGDSLRISDELETEDQSYELTASTFGRTTPGSTMATIEYQGIEDLVVWTTQGVATVLISGTAPAANVRLTTQDSGDRIEVEDTGADGNVMISTAAGADNVLIRDTGEDGGAGAAGLGSFLTVDTHNDADTIRLIGNGLASRLQLSGAGGADQIAIDGTADASLTVAEGGDGNDEISVGQSPRTIDQILGDICVVGGGQDSSSREIVRTGQIVPGIPYTPESRFVYEEPVAIDAGDTLNLYDDQNADGNEYLIDADSVARGPLAIASFEEIETINLTSGEGDDQLVVQLPVTASVITFDAGGQTEADRLIVEGDASSNDVRIAPKVDESPVRSPFEIGGVELVQVRGGSSLATDHDTLINDTGVPALLLGEGGNDVHVGGTGTDVAIGGTGIDAMFGNTGDDFLIADVSLLSVDIEPMVSTEIAINPTGGDLIFGNLGEGNDLGYFDQAVALVPAESQPDFVDEVEFLIENGAVKGVWSWLLAIFPEPSEASIQALVDRAITRLLLEAGATSLPSESVSGNALEAAESESLEIDAVSLLDVNRDGQVSPIDALLILNEINQGGASATDQTTHAVDRVLDVSGDGHVSPIDALHVINYLNDRSPSSISRGAAAVGADYAAAILALDLDDEEDDS